MVSITIRSTDNFSVKDLERFAAGVGDNEKIRVKTDGQNITLYSSSKGGSGLKNFLFGTSAKRQDAARDFIGNVLANVPNKSSGFAFAAMNLLQNLPQNGEIRGADLKTLTAQAGPRSMVPAGIDLDGEGRLSGTVLTHTSDYKGTAVPTKDAIEGYAQNEYDKHVNRTNPLPDGQLTNLGGQDAYRLDINVGGYKTQSQPIPTSAAAYCKFTGNDKAATVLGTILTQDVLGTITGGLETTDGRKLMIMPKGTGQQATFIQDDGQQKTVTTGQYDGQINVSKMSNGDYKVTISWDLYFDTLRDRNPKNAATVADIDKFQLSPGHVALASMSAEIIVDHVAAEAGKVSVTLPQPPSITISGRLDANHPAIA